MENPDIFHFEVGHIGINCRNSGEALSAAFFLADIFGLGLSRDTPFSQYAGPFIEIVKEGGRGKHGHIAVTTSDIDAAMAYLQRRGVKLDQESIKRNEKGEISVIYLKDDLAGFAIHLQRKDDGGKK